MKCQYCGFRVGKLYDVKSDDGMQFIHRACENCQLNFVVGFTSSLIQETPNPNDEQPPIRGQNGI